MKIPDHLRFTGAISPVISLENLESGQELIVDIDTVINSKYEKGYFSAFDFWKLLTKTLKVAENDTSRGYVNLKAIERAKGKGIRKDISYLKQIQRGIELEPLMIETYEKKTGIKLIHTGKNQKRCVVEEYNTLSYPDGIDENFSRCVEGKCPDIQNHLDNVDFSEDLKWFKSERFDYYTQAQVQMWTADLGYCDFVSFTDDEDIIEDKRCWIVEIQRDEAFIDLCKKTALANMILLKEALKRHQKHFIKKNTEGV